MKILVACEFSGIVRDAFIAKGHDAISCDLLPSERPGPHIQGPVENIINGGGYDLMIAHPPCTHLAVSGARYFAQKRADGRQQQAIAFFMLLANAPIEKICVENPVCIMSTTWRKPDQTIQPYQFGHQESKATCLWLKNLPRLTPTKVCEPVWYKTPPNLWQPDGEDYRDKKGKRYSPTHYLTGRAQRRLLNQTPSGQNNLGPSADMAKIRSRTYQGIADAMADQWGRIGNSVPPPVVAAIVQANCGEQREAVSA